MARRVLVLTVIILILSGCQSELPGGSPAASQSPPGMPDTWTPEPSLLPTLGPMDLPPIDINIGMIFFVILIATVIMTPLSFYLSVGMQYLGGRLFGGSGTFKVHAFLMALVQVPMTVMSGVVTLLALIPVVNILAGLAGFGLSIYGIILTVRMVKVVHGLGTGQAVAAIIIAPVVLSLIGGCLILTIGSSLLGSLMQLQ